MRSRHSTINMKIPSELSHILIFALTAFSYISIIAVYSTVLLLTALVIGVLTFRRLLSCKDDVDIVEFWVIFAWADETSLQF